MDLSRATASAICNSSSRLAATVPAILLLLLRVVARLQVFVDELVGEHELGVGDGAEGESDLGIAIFCIRRADYDVLAIQAEQGAAKPAAASVLFVIGVA